MQFRYFVAAVVWIAAVTATLESDSHGNWSNEKKVSEHRFGEVETGSEAKKETKIIEDDQSSKQHKVAFNSSQIEKSEEIAADVKFVNRNDENDQANESQPVSKQIVQPYLLSPKSKSVSVEIVSELPGNVPRLSRTSQTASNETVTVEYIPSKEILIQDTSTTPKYLPQENGSNDLGQSMSDENLDTENVAEFGQRVRPSASQRQRNSENAGRFRPRQPIDFSSPLEDLRKQYRKGFRVSSVKKLNVSDGNSYAPTKDRLPFTLTKTSDSQWTLKQKETDGDHSESPSTIKETSLSVSGPIMSVSLGKFTGPIVVPDLPKEKKYSYTATPDYTESNELTKSTAPPSETVNSKHSENVYLAASPVILNPLQVGVALMNAGQDLNLVSDQTLSSTKEYSRDDVDVPQISDDTSESVVQSDTPDSGNSSYHGDQVSQQEQISEVVAVNSPTQSVEIQKSVEIFHTAPIQEIHYPVEFVPHVAQALVKQRPAEDYRKSLRSQFKDQRSGQVNIYRSNEILEEAIPANNHERSRYEYNANENDVIYSASNGQTDQILPLPRPLEAKPVFGAKEQVESAQYDQTAVKHYRIQEIPETIIKQADYELPQGSSSTIAQPPRGIDGLSSLANLENPQNTQEVAGIGQILPTKSVTEPPTEFRLLMSAPQLYTVEKSHALDGIEKKLPFPVEKVIEKQITIPQPFAVHVPVDRVVEKQIRIPYPVHVEKVIEKKVPFAIQRFIIPLPIHFRVPQPVPFPVEKVVEKPVPVPVPVEKVAEKPFLHLTRPYSLEIEKSRPYSLESTKLLKSGPIYNVQNDGNYQQTIRQSFQVPVGPSYGVDGEQGYHNSTAQFYSSYLALNRPHVRQQPLVYTLPKKFGGYGVQYPHSVAYSVNNGNLVAYGRGPDKDKMKDEYVGPVPRKVQASLGMQSKILYSAPEMQSTLRRPRQETVMGNTGSFRQSKMEYGFKPPMVPSVQYDEQTATKVE